MRLPLSDATRTALRGLAAALFCGQFATLDLCFRGPRAYLTEPRLLVNAAGSAALWYLAWTLRTRRPARVAVACVAAAVLTAQVFVFRYYHMPIDGQVVAAAAHSWGDVRPILLRLLPGMLAAIAVVAVIEHVVLGAGPIRAPSASRRLPATAAFGASLLLGAPLRDGTPDLRLVESVRALSTPPAGARVTDVALPILPSSRAALPSVLFIITESIRASDYCTARTPDCRVSPEVDALLPDRAPLLQMRSIASYTAISISALITGRSQEGPLADIAQAPNVFDFLRSTRAGRDKPTVAYWSAQLESIFERKDLRAATDSFLTLDDLMGRKIEDEDSVIDQAVDRRLAERAEREMAASTGPLFAVVHFAGTHAPYFVEERDTPFQPWERVVAWSKMPTLRNAYRNAIHEQDKSIARAIRAFLARTKGAPWLVVLTSDHGEAFGEHSAIHHGQSLYDEQIHVPGFVAHGGGALTPEQANNLRAWEPAFTTHLDLLPTILDAYGVLDGIAMDPYRGGLAGRSMLRPVTKMRAPLPITNCTAIFPCGVSNWGLLHEGYALVAQPWDYGWHCVDLASGDERVDLAHPACARLRAASKAHYPLMPNRRPNE